MFGIAGTPPPENAFWTDDPYNYSFLAESPAQFPPGTAFLPDRPLVQSSPPPAALAMDLDTMESDVKPFDPFALPAHLRPPTPPSLPISSTLLGGEYPVQAGMDWCAVGGGMLSHVKQEEDDLSSWVLDPSLATAFASGSEPVVLDAPEFKLEHTLGHVLGADVVEQVKSEMKVRPNKRQREERARSYWRALAIGF